jgi:hypothetical protein
LTSAPQFQIPHCGAKKAGLMACYMYKKIDDRHDTCTVQYSTVRGWNRPLGNGIRLALTESEHLSALAL